MEGEAIRIAFSGGEVLVRLVGQGAKNVPKLIAFIKALLDKEKLAGESKLLNMLKNSNGQQIITMSRNDYARFRDMVKDYGVVYAQIGHMEGLEEMDIMVRREDISKCNRIFERMGSKYRIHEDSTQSRESVRDQMDGFTREAREANEPERPTVEREISKMDVETVRQAVSNINQSVPEGFTQSNWKAYLEMQSVLYEYSQKNKEKIYDQMPDATMVMSKTRWMEIGRDLTDDAQGVYITMPEIDDQGMKTGGFKDVLVYDISETQGKEIDYSEYFTRINDAELSNIITGMKKKYSVEVTPDLETDALFDPKSGTIKMQQGLSREAQFQALQREVVYAQCAKSQGEKFTREANRLRAESAVYALSTKYGLDASHIDLSAVEGLKESSKALEKLRMDAIKDITQHGKEVQKVMEKFRSGKGGREM
jgi:hypothetical protein